MIMTLLTIAGDNRIGTYRIVSVSEIAVSDACQTFPGSPECYAVVESGECCVSVMNDGEPVW